MSVKEKENSKTSKAILQLVFCGKEKKRIGWGIQQQVLASNRTKSDTLVVFKRLPKGVPQLNYDEPQAAFTD